MGAPLKADWREERRKRAWALKHEGWPQKDIATAYIAQLNAAHVFKRPIVTTVAPLQGFFLAEEYHQNFLKRNPTYPYIVYNDLPKLEALKAQWPELLKKKGGTK